MSSRCKNCGGIMKYDIASEKVKCEYCDSTFDPASFNKDMAAEEQQADPSEYTTTVFSCPSCGAHISSTELSAVEYCMYCGSFVTLSSQMEKVKKPDLILPFSKTEEECKNIYREKVKKMIYAPKEFRDEKFVEGFKGIYIPFWNYEYEYGPEIIIRGRDENRKGDYIYTQHYTVKCKASGALDNVTYDASSTFDDDISSRIAPFERKKMKPFTPAYMCGFFGDTADIKGNVYTKVADDTAHDVIWEHFSKDPKVAPGHPVEEKPKSFEKDFNISKKSSLAMLPVWFLTWRKGDRVAYSVVNGDSGEIYTEIPVDTKRYLLFSLLTALPVFFLLNLSFTFSASEMLKIAMIMACFMIMMFTNQLDKIVRRVMHTDDVGYLSVHEEAKKQSDAKVKDNIIIAAIIGAVDFVKSLGLVSTIILMIAAFSIGGRILVAILVIAVLVIPVYTIYRIYSDSKILNDKSVWLDCAGALLAIVISGIILIWDPAPDKFYYFSAIACMLGVGFTAIRLMKRYNELITRPVPHFFERQKGEKA